MGETKLTGPSVEERIAKRLLNSGEGANPDTIVQKGTSPQRTFHNIHSSPGSKARGNDGPTRKPLIPTP